MKDDSARRFNCAPTAARGSAGASPSRNAMYKRKARSEDYRTQLAMVRAYGIEAASTLAPSSIGTRGSGIVAWYFSLTASM